MKIKHYLCVFTCVLVINLFSQTLVYQQNTDAKDLETWMSLGLSRWNVPAPKKGIFKYDSLYLLSHTDSLGATICATPILSLWLGKENGQAELKYQNSRGLLLTGGYRNFSCFAMIVENQAIFPAYQKYFVETHGEYYPVGNAYNQQNAMIPGAGRTKAFKSTGFDYAYSQGGMQWDLFQRISIFGGNCALQFGEGIRSLFWSAHNQVALIGAKIRLGRHFQFVFSKGKLQDLIRKPLYAGVESPYYKKGYSMNALTYTHNKIHVGAIYQTVWEGGDSLKERPFSSWYWAPFPGFDMLAKERASLPQVGLMGRYSPNKIITVYGEGFFRGLSNKTLSYQLGVKFQPVLSQSASASLNISYISVGKTFYGDNYSLSFSSNNLPLGSLMGNGTHELLISGKFAYKRLYMNLLMQYYTTKSGQNILFRESYLPENRVIHGVGEVGVFINYITQTVIFTCLDYRIGTTSFPKTLFVSSGIKTALFQNHYAY